MNFLKLDYLLPIMIVFVVFAILLFKKKASLDIFIKKTFFKNPSKILHIRRLFLLLGTALLLIALLDPRGPEERIESNIPDQKTIVIIDSSASMLAEDVRPNRFKKSLLMARHFIKKAFGHKIAVVLFSDTQKRLVPFTDDLDLLDARVAGLEDLNIYDGGSNISQAIKESLGYFLVDGGKIDDVGGNILLFTDSEGHDEAFELKLPEQVTLAAVGVGTAKGARIPNRDRFGVFRGYKKYKSTEITSKLNESWLKQLGDTVDTYRYWVANSYTIPTEEVLSFFNKSYSKKIKKGMATVRPVKVKMILVPALVFLSLYYAFYFFPSYTLSFLLLTTIGLVSPRANEYKSGEIEQLMERMKKGELSKEGKLKFAEILLKAKENEASQVLYEENLKEAKPADLNNYAISLIQNKQPEKAIKILSDIQQRARDGKLSLTDSERDEIRQNMLLALQTQKQQSQQKKQEEKEEKENKDKQKNKGSGQEGDSKGQEKKQESGEGEEKNKKEDKKSKGDKKSSEEDAGEKKKKAKSLKERQEEIRKKRKMVKIPGLIKQIMSDDRALQKKYLDTSTKKPKVYQKKDW